MYLFLLRNGEESFHISKARVFLNPIAYGGALFGPHHQTGSQNSRTLSPRVSKISEFFFMPFGHIVVKFQAD